MGRILADGLSAELEERGAAPGDDLGDQIGTAGGEQLPLLADDELTEARAAAMDQFGCEPVAMRGPGRPKGARNRRTKETAEYLLATGKDPLKAAFEVVNMAPEQVRSAFQLPPDKAANLWRDCLAMSLPYFHSKKPLDVVSDGERIANVTIIMDGDGITIAPPDMGGEKADEAGEAPLRAIPANSMTYDDDDEEVAPQEVAPQGESVDNSDA